MKKTSIIFIVFLIAVPSYAQQKTMSEQLWDRVQNCYKMFIDDKYGDEEENYANVIDDSNNGYLKVSGSFPTCGCSCESIVGAFRKDDNTFLFLEENIWSCS